MAAFACLFLCLFVLVRGTPASQAVLGAWVCAWALAELVMGPLVQLAAQPPPPHSSPLRSLRGFRGSPPLAIAAPQSSSQALAVQVAAGAAVGEPSDVTLAALAPLWELSQPQGRRDARAAHARDEPPVEG